MAFKKIQKEIDLKLYSVFICFPQKDKVKPKHVTTRMRFNKIIREKMEKAISREIVRSTDYQNANEIPFIDSDKKDILTEAINIDNSSDWEKFSKLIAEKYTDQTLARDALLILFRYDIKGINGAAILRYDLASRMRLGTDDLEDINNILGRYCTKSALYPSISTTLKPKTNLMKVYQKSQSNYFVDFIGLQNESINLEQKIDSALYKKFKSKKVILKEFLTELNNLIAEKENLTGVNIKKDIDLVVETETEISTLIDNIGKNVIVEVQNGKCIIEIQDLNPKLKYYLRYYQLG